MSALQSNPWRPARAPTCLPPRGRLISASSPLGQGAGRRAVSPGPGPPAGCPLGPYSAFSLFSAALKRRLSRRLSGGGERSGCVGSAHSLGVPRAEARGREPRSPADPEWPPCPGVGPGWLLATQVDPGMGENARKLRCPRICLGCPLGRQAPPHGVSGVHRCPVWGPKVTGQARVDPQPAGLRPGRTSRGPAGTAVWEDGVTRTSSGRRGG